MKEILCLGRNGDIVNALPLAKHLAGDGKVRFIVNERFASALRGLDYIEPVVVSGDYSELPAAMLRHPTAHVCQIYKHPTQWMAQRLTSNYQREAWRVAGFQELYGKLPIDLGKRKSGISGPYILLALTGVSSPIKNRKELTSAIRSAFGSTHRILDSDDIVVDSPLDLVGYIEGADCMVCIDSLYLHLSRATSTPTIALIQDGWFGSDAPPSSTLVFRYSAASGDKFISDVCGRIERVVKKCPGKIFHVFDDYGTSDRHSVAKEKRQAIYPCGITPVPCSQYRRNSASIGDNRRLPFWKDIIGQGLERAKDDDIIIWTNSDNGFEGGIIEWARKYVWAHGAISMRRDEPGHVGRDLFAFRASWLRHNMASIPDYIHGASDWDLGMVAYIRKQKGISTTLANAAHDFQPCDSPLRLVTHVPHKSEWLGSNQAPVIHNRKAFMQWASWHAPEIKFDRNGVLA